MEPGEHRLRFVLLRRSEELRFSLKEDEERQFLCGSNGFGWPALGEASPEDVAMASFREVLVESKSWPSLLAVAK